MTFVECGPCGCKQFTSGCIICYHIAAVRAFASYEFPPRRLVLLCCWNPFAKFGVKSSATSKANWIVETLPFQSSTDLWKVKLTSPERGNGCSMGGGERRRGVVICISVIGFFWYLLLSRLQRRCTGTCISDKTELHRWH